MHLKPYGRFLKRSTTYIRTTSSIAVGQKKLETSRSRPDIVADLKPENLLYVTRHPDSSLVLADFGIAKTLDDKHKMLTSMAGSFGYAAPEVMLKRGHSKPVDMWSMGVITYTLLCGYSPWRSENLQDLISEMNQNKVAFHERYWKDVSSDAKDFIASLLQVDPAKRPTSEASN